MTWQNRIVGHGDEPPARLVAHPQNWRVHSAHQQAALAGALAEIGWVQRVIVNQRTGHLLDGHLRVSLALERGEPTVPVVYVDLTPDEEALVLATLDPIGALAGADAEHLRALTATLAPADAALAQLVTTLQQQADDQLAALQPPSLAALAERYGEVDDTAFWPVLRLKLPLATYQRYQALIATVPGATEADQFAGLLALVEEVRR